MGFFKALETVIITGIEAERELSRKERESSYIVYDGSDPEQAGIIAIYKSVLTEEDDFYACQDANKIYKIAKKSQNGKTKAVGMEALGSIAERMEDDFYKSQVAALVETLLKD